MPPVKWSDRNALRGVLTAALVLLWALHAPAPLWAQDDDRGFIQGLLEDALSSDGMDVRLEGFRGALSSRATVDRITIGDPEGIWLSAEDVALVWTRSALTRGAVEIDEISIGRLALPRAPQLPPSPPSPEARSPFALPELPVSVRLADLRVTRAEIGAALLGQDAVFALAGSAGLAGGAGEADLDVTRLDRGGAIALSGRYSNADRQLAVDLSLSEPEGGLAVSLLGVPGAPSAALSLQGDAPIDDFEARLTLATDGQERLGGTVVLRADGAADTRRFRVDVSGDLAPVVAPEYHAFLGNDVGLVAEVVQESDGRITLRDMDLRAQALRLTGFARIAADGWPEELDLQGAIVPPSGDRVRLPIGGRDVSVARVDLSGRFDAAVGNGWQLSAQVQEARRSDLGAVSRLALTGGGEIARAARQVSGALVVSAEGLALADAALAQAVGTALQGRVGFDWAPEAPLRLRDLDLSGADYGLRGEITVSGAGALDPQVRPNVLVEAGNLSRFAALAGVALEGAADLRLRGSVAPVTGGFDLAVAGGTQGLALGIAQVDPLLAGQGTLRLEAVRDTGGLRLTALDVRTAGAQITGTAALATGGSRASLDVVVPDSALVLPELSGPSQIALEAQQTSADWQVVLTGDLPQAARVRYAGTVTPDTPDGPRVAGRLEADVARLQAFADLVGQPLEGAAALTVEGSGAPLAQVFDVALSARMRDVALGVATLDPLLAGQSTLRASVAAADGQVTLSDMEITGAANLVLDGTVAAQLPAEGAAFDPLTLAAAGRVRADVPRLGPFSGLVGRALSGAVRADLAVEGRVLDVPLSVQGRVTTEDVALSLPEIDPLLAGASQLQVDAVRLASGAVEVRDLSLAGAITGRASGTVEGLGTDQLAVDGRVSAQVPRLSVFSRLSGQALRGSATATAEVAGDALQGPLAVQAQVTTSGLAIGQAMVDPFLAGQLRADLSAVQLGSGALRIDQLTLTGAALNGAVSGTVAADQAAVRLDLSVDGVERVVPDLAGRVTVSGSAGHSGGPWQLDLQTAAQGGIGARAVGTVAQDVSRADLSLTGQVPLALLNGRIAPQVATGVARFDLGLNGAPGLSALNGQVTLDGARIAAPAYNVSLDGISGGLRLAGGQAVAAINGTLSSGGRIVIAGPVGLDAPYAAGLNIALKGARLRQADLFETTTEGQITIQGPLLGGARIGGRVLLGQVEVRVPQIGPSYAALDGLRHLNPPPDVARTLQFAGLDQRSAEGGGAAVPDFPLDLVVEAPNKIFVRGRGLDAELGGSLRLTGTSADIQPVGQFDLIRGRLDLLGRRLDLTEGAVFLQGSFDPIVSFSAVSTVEDTEITISLAGPASAPELTVTSSPELPQDEALAFFLFGQSVTELSPLQAVQLAAAIQSLTGRGGLGLTEGLRTGLGVDDLDIGTDADGGVEARVGKYISDNIYTDVVVGSDGKSEINLNLTVNPSVTVRGRVSSDGTSGVGVFFERDY